MSGGDYVRTPLWIYLVPDLYHGYCMINIVHDIYHGYCMINITQLNSQSLTYIISLNNTLKRFAETEILMYIMHVMYI